MLDEGNNENLETPEAPPPEESNNRTFLIVGGIFAALIFLTLVCGAIYVLWLGPRLTSQRNAAQATIEAKNAQVISQLTATAEAALFTPTSLPTTTPTNTSAPVVIPVNSPTAVIASGSSVGAATSTYDPATLAALQTQLSQQMTSTVVVQANLSQQMTSTSIARGTGIASAMPRTGFFDQVGLPTLVILAFALVVVIFLARRMRRSP
jgi:hypothetical protein